MTMTIIMLDPHAETIKIYPSIIAEDVILDIMANTCPLSSNSASCHRSSFAYKSVGKGKIDSENIKLVTRHLVKHPSR